MSFHLLYRYEEINNYDWSIGWSRNGKKIGHYTQMVWQSTRRVGYAVITRTDPLQPNVVFAMLIAKYHKNGNIIGRVLQNIGKNV